ncbi:quinone oxidoreductase family protein [Lentzea sp. NEAU-D7]|uniref:quinone oxidoreductase family protein n=1 Tax=Lentzea sp. NEAU-D7 TaxID=2994667 RepID=UPI00224B2B3D|nr:zinc-binding alcohol dehydrogenase family protein [Lentzea sp. NEAU-D7]MCX2948702.1 zinc-binding alcohol dehydrogenase family protein [Lentzea sp. NEAU-D7]MCX2951260.1 zinc-binding alcohol dehydrogenase family protein [Lentzea sp. NEAU-D7]
MRAAVVVRPGQPPSLVDRDEPSGEVVVDVLAAPITPLDRLCASGTSYFGVPATPYVPGVQGIGTVSGRTVWFPTSAGMAPGDGSMAAKALVREEDLVFLPDVDPVVMAALGLSAVAAYEALSSLSPGESVVVLGCGAVGQAAIQLARLAGAGRVAAAARSAEGRARAVRAGADVVVPLEDVAEAAQGADLLIDPLFGEPAAAAARALRPGARWVNLGGSAGETSPITSSTLRSRSLRLSGYTNNELTARQRAEAISAIAGHAAAGALAVDHEVVPLADVTDAWDRTAHGRVVLAM